MDRRHFLKTSLALALLSCTSPTALFGSEKPLRIWVCGDNTGGFSEKQMRAIRNLYDKLPPAQYAISIGDVSDGNSRPDNMARELKYISDFITPFKSIGKQKPLYPLPKENRYFPCPGNHDILVTPKGSETPGATYKNWLGIKQAYYAKSLPNVDLFFLDSVAMEPTPEGERSWLVGNCTDNAQEILLNTTTQGKWWKKELKKSKAPWKITIMHHPPYDSIRGHYKGGHADVRFPYDKLDVDLVLSGHEHGYERLNDGKTDYIVQGVGGGHLRPLVDILPFSKYQCVMKIGVCMLVVTPKTLSVEWYTADKKGNPVLSDKLTLNK